jgi:hypothetical protein
MAFRNNFRHKQNIRKIVTAADARASLVAKREQAAARIEAAEIKKQAQAERIQAQAERTEKKHAIQQSKDDVKRQALALKEQELQRQAIECARVEQIVAPLLKLPLPETADDILRRADAAYLLAMTKANAAAAVSAARLEADVLGVIVQKTLHANMGDEFSRARTRDDYVELVAKRHGPRAAEKFARLIDELNEDEAQKMIEGSVEDAEITDAEIIEPDGNNNGSE